MQFELLLADGEGLQKGTSDRIIGTVQTVHPFLHHVHVAQFAQAAKKALARFLHLFPFRIGIDGGDARDHGTAAAESNPQIVYRVGREGHAGAVALFEYAPHPESKAGFLLDTLRRDGHNGHRNSRLAGFRGGYLGGQSRHS